MRTASDLFKHDGVLAAMTEEVRRVVADLAADAKRPQSILLTGPHGGEGVTTIAAAIATGLSFVPNTKTLLIDGNIRNPKLQTVTGGAIEPGLMGWDGAGDPPIIEVESMPGLKFLSAGKFSAEGFVESHALGSRFAQRVSQITEWGKRNFDFLIWDSAPVTKYSDAKVIAKNTDSVFFVVVADETRMDHLAYARDQIQIADGRIIGAIMNRHGRYWPVRKKGR